MSACNFCWYCGLSAGQNNSLFYSPAPLLLEMNVRDLQSREPEKKSGAGFGLLLVISYNVIPPGIRYILSLSIPPTNSFHSLSSLKVFLFSGWDQKPNVFMHCPTGRVKVCTLHVCTDGTCRWFGALFLTSNPMLYPQDHQVFVTRCFMVMGIFSIGGELICPKCQNTSTVLEQIKMEVLRMDTWEKQKWGRFFSLY